MEQNTESQTSNPEEAKCFGASNLASTVFRRSQS